MEKRKGTKFVKTLPKGSGRIVGMIQYGGLLYIAFEKGIWYLSHPMTRFTRCKFNLERARMKGDGKVHCGICNDKGYRWGDKTKVCVCQKQKDV